MVTVLGPAGASNAPADVPASRWPWGRRPDAPFVAVVVLAVLPVVATVASLVGGHWHPVSDAAMEVLRIDDVGGSHTPLTGAYSRLGWHHPGPLLFWLLAPFDRVFGTTGVLVGVAVLNAVATVGALIIARRRGGRSLVALVGLVLLVLVQANGTDLLIDPWNPWVAVLPFFTYVLLAWSVAERDLQLLPWLVAAGTFAVQAHVGYAPLVLGAGVTGALLAWRRPADRGWPRARRSMWLALLVGVVLWLPPVVQQLVSDRGNLAELVSYFRDPTEAPVGWRTGWGIMGTELGFPGAWLAGGELGPFGVQPSSEIPALVLLAATAALGALAWRRGSPSAGRLAVLVVAVSGCGVVAGSRVSGLVGSYVVRWWWVIAAAVWLSVCWSLVCCLAHGLARDAVFVVAVTASVLVSVVVAGRAVPASFPNASDSVVVGELGREVAPHLDPEAAYLVDWTDGRDWGAVGTGMYLQLDRLGFSVALPPRFAPSFGAWRTASASEVDGVVLVVAHDDAEAGFRPPPGAVVVARYDPLTAGERARARILEEELREHGVPSAVDSPFSRQVLEDAGAPRSVIDELADLRARGSAYTVYLES